MKPIRSLLLFPILIMIFFICSGAVLAEDAFPDVDPSDAYYDAVQTLYDYGVVGGYPDGKFHPENEITRAELVKMVNKVFHYQYGGTVNPFVDVKSNAWYYQEVLTAVERNYIFGYPDDTFRGNVNVTREQVCVIVDRNVHLTLLPFDKEISDPVAPWARDAVEKFVSNYIWRLEAGNCFRAKMNGTRAEVAIALARFCFDDEPLPQDSLEVVMSRVIRQLEDSLANGSLMECSEEQREIVAMIIDNMDAVLEDPNHDYRTPADAAMASYRALPTEDRAQLKESILCSCGSEDLIRLQEYFFPDMSF